MKKTIPLSVIVDAIEATTDGWRQFYNTVTGEVDSIPSWDNAYINPDEFRETADKIDESDDYVELPTQRELHEYDIMERFAEKKGSAPLLRALRGRKPFRTFKDRAIEIGLEQEYYAFRSAAYVEIAREWCRENEIPFIEEDELADALEALSNPVIYHDDKEISTSTVRVLAEVTGNLALKNLIPEVEKWEADGESFTMLRIANRLIEKNGVDEETLKACKKEAQKRLHHTR